MADPGSFPRKRYRYIGCQRRHEGGRAGRSRPARCPAIGRGGLEWRLDPACPDRHPRITEHGHRIIVICNEGYSSSLAAATLLELGLHMATDLVGGFHAWRRQTGGRAPADGEV